MTAQVQQQSPSQKPAYQTLAEIGIVISCTYKGAEIGALAGAILSMRASDSACFADRETQYLFDHLVPQSTGPGDLIPVPFGFLAVSAGFFACIAKGAIPGAIIGGYCGYKLGKRLLQPL